MADHSGPPSPGSGEAFDRARALERSGDLAGALAAYEAALAAQPNDPDILAALATLAGRMEMHEVAAALWAQVSLAQPGRLEALDGRARALRDLGRFDEAIGLLRETLLANPQEPRLWNSLGVTLTQDGQAELALTFLGEAVRLDPGLATAPYNRGNAHFDLGQLDAAAADYAAAAEASHDTAEGAVIAFAQATLALARGDLATGWDGYQVRLSPLWPKAVTFDAPGRPWTPGDDLAGRHLLVLAEQGLGDELMFANLLPDVVHALGPDGQLSLAVEPRLVELFRRSFPAAQVGAHATDSHDGRRRRAAPNLASPRPVDLWAPMGALPQGFRRAITDFPTAPGYLKPDPARIAHWKAWLGEGPPAVGITWRSGKLGGDRQRQYPPLELWAPIASTPGLRVVNLQYGDCAGELAELAALAGRPILQPPGLDLREDLEGLAALTVALDLTISVSNATAALAGACGAPLLLIGGPANWARLGTNAYPWYPQARMLTAQRFGDWAKPMADAAAEVAKLARPG
ncbi:MAG TPA: tetratricopeptide repeat protein [Phenylobacterium sp.]|jgi:Tfp pilus assembly protein PilF|nr:tetratricopeptide repeat protein [Phenylobacterium sp.]